VDNARPATVTAADIVAHYGGTAGEGPWPWVAEAWTISKVLLYWRLLDSVDGDDYQGCDAQWQVACADGTPWWVSLPDLSPTGAVLHALALIWNGSDTPGWSELRSSFREHYEYCYSGSELLLIDAMVWVTAGDNVLGEYGHYRAEPPAWENDEDCAADPVSPPAHLREALEIALFNCAADPAAIAAGGWGPVADRVCLSPGDILAGR